jgi:mono/diheme cytochrome c family protein
MVMMIKNAEAAAARNPLSSDRTARYRLGWVGITLGSAVWLASCAIEIQNTQAAQEVAQLSKPPGSVYTGWRVFQEKCAVCHGPAAAGSAGGPDLLPRVRDMGPRQFASLVLNRYDWGLPTAQPGTDGATREALIDAVVQGRQGTPTMPAWEGEPVVSAQIADLYAYVSARAQGTQGPGRPAP